MFKYILQFLLDTFISLEQIKGGVDRALDLKLDDFYPKYHSWPFFAVLTSSSHQTSLDPTFLFCITGPIIEGLSQCNLAARNTQF